MEAIWCGSLLGLLNRCGSFGGLTTAGKDIFLPAEPGEPSFFLGPGRAGPRLDLRKGSRLTLGGRLGFKGWGPSGGRGLLSGVTSPALLCRGCCRSGTGVEVGAGAEATAGAGAGVGLGAGGFWCLSIMFCSISPVCLTFPGSPGWVDALTPGYGGGRGKEGLEAAIGSTLGNLTRPGLAIGGGGTVGDSLWCARSLSVSGRISFPNPGRGDFGEPLSRLLVSEVLALLLNRALRALTSTVSPMFAFSDGLLMDKVLHVQQ